MGRAPGPGTVLHPSGPCPAPFNENLAQKMSRSRDHMDEKSEMLNFASILNFASSMLNLQAVTFLASPERRQLANLTCCLQNLICLQNSTSRTFHSFTYIPTSI